MHVQARIRDSKLPLGGAAGLKLCVSAAFTLYELELGASKMDEYKEGKIMDEHLFYLCMKLLNMMYWICTADVKILFITQNE